MGFASGFRAGYDVVSAAEERRRKEELRQGLQRESARFTPTEVASGEEALRGFREGTAQTDTFTIPNADGSSGLTVTPDQYEQMYLGDLQQRPAGYMVEQAVVPELGGRQYETLAAAEQAVAPSRAAGLANVYRQAGDVAEAEQLMGLSRGAQLQNLQISEAQRQQDFNTALQDLNKQTFEKPEDRAAATLDVFRTYDPKGAAVLEDSYTRNELTKITLRAQKFEEGYNQARAKGVDSVIKWYDGINDGFTLSREGNQIIQTDTAGNQRVFAQGTDAEIMKEINKVAQPDKFLKTAETEANIKKSEEETKLAEARRLGLPAAAQTDAQRQNIALADQFRKQIADANKLLENYAEGTPQHNAVLAERNAAAMALKDVNRLLQPGGLTRRGAQTAGSDFDEAGRKAAFDAARSGINPVTKEPYTKADKEQFEEYFGVKFPESAPAQPSKPANPRAARAARPDTIPPAPPKKITIGRSTRERDNPEYAAWLETYGSRLGLK